MNKELINSLKESGLRSPTDFINAYVDNEEDILKQITSFQGIKSELYVQDINNVIDITKYLALYADFTSVFMMPDKVRESIIHYYEPGDPHFIKRNITFPIEELNGITPKAHDLLPAYTTQNNLDFKNAFQRFNPLVESGKFMIRPIRTIIVNKSAIMPTGRIDRYIFYANSDTPNDDWHVKRINEKDSYVIHNGLRLDEAKTLYEITLPYINNVPIEKLNKIIEDEADLLANFRVSLKELMRASTVSDRYLMDELRNDKIRPQIEAINRKFKTLINTHRLAIGASVTGITLHLIGVVAGLGTDFQSIFNAYVAGGSGIGMLASEIRFQSEEDKLKDNPYFLLWKISKAKTSQILKQF